ncbi:hypothetical protein AGR1A_Lc40064 [Agrobacterium fabacearum CFBP 5771]|nr:hypothetical protein AGR1A_Lc40064 [Agrobacterium fabacearum CFBP 5771]
MPIVIQFNPQYFRVIYDQFE